MALSDISRIKRIREKYNITQKELAGRAKVSQSLIARIEGGEIDPRYSKVRSILSALDELDKKEAGPKAGDIMSGDVLGVQVNDSVDSATNIMRSNNISQLPVFDGSRLVGSISEKIIIHQISSKVTFEQLSNKRVGEIMGGIFPSIDPKTPLSVISTLLGHSLAVVVMDRGNVTGIITKADLLRFIHK